MKKLSMIAVLLLSILSVAHAGVFGSTDNSTTNKNTNNNSSYSSSNLSNKNYTANYTKNKNRQKQQQGQQQGQVQGNVGINKAVGTGNTTSTEVTVEGDEQEKRLPVNSAAPTVATGEGSGISFQTPSFGGSFSRSSDVHNHLMVAKAFQELGMEELAVEHVKKAAAVANYKGEFGKFWTTVTLGLF